jgi:hypothetical protein
MLYPKTVETPPGPERIVFDLWDIEPVFRKKVNWMKDFEGSLPEVLELLPPYINNPIDAEAGLKSYMEWTVKEHAMQGSENDGKIYAGAIQLVGQYMIDQFIKLGLYRDGMCHYVPDGWLDSYSPVYKKVSIEELFNV